MLKCPKANCGLTEPDFHKCGSMRTCAIKLGAPAEVVRTDGRDVVLDCENCDETRVTTASALASSGRLNVSMSCKLGAERCECKAFIPKAPKAPATTVPAPAKVAPDGEGSKG